ncbi:hypothetical protein L1987_23628 [Smallanthus sonchifolius]|uniref:Uncharacterized protein n=1 Tax=Smallanthus sonchifolius TaxID=185202 RepID=A0ACB9IIE9_9ASTR|nr:hypothetical protein L1987_23628 [Smallanthus sonchifolius]
MILAWYGKSPILTCVLCPNLSNLGTKVKTSITVINIYGKLYINQTNLLRVVVFRCIQENSPQQCGVSYENSLPQSTEEKNLVDNMRLTICHTLLLLTPCHLT